MSEPENSQQEPTMEEILASIRRIISEDGEEGEGAEGADDADVAEDVAAADAEPDVSPEPEPEEEPDATEALAAALEEVTEPDDGGDVLELTQPIEEEPEVAAAPEEPPASAPTPFLLPDGWYGPPDWPEGMNALTGEFTPPGILFWARLIKALDLFRSIN